MQTAMKTARRWQLAHGRHLDLGPKALVMGILNVTPDSFSDGGRFDTAERALEQAALMGEQGAAIVDVGGESTRPGATAVSAREEQRRILPVIETLSTTGKALISVDTYREETARLAVAAGAHIVNDVHGLQREPAIARLAAETGAGLVIMHTGRDREKLPDVIADQFLFLEKSLEIARDAGVGDNQIVLDPGFGFAKDRRGKPSAHGSFRGAACARPSLACRHLAQAHGRGHNRPRSRTLRDPGTAATSVILRVKGADLFRVHNVAMNVDALVFADAMLERQSSRES